MTAAPRRESGGAWRQDMARSRHIKGPASIESEVHDLFELDHFVMKNVVACDQIVCLQLHDEILPGDISALGGKLLHTAYGALTTMSEPKPNSYTMSRPILQIWSSIFTHVGEANAVDACYNTSWITVNREKTLIAKT